MSRCEVATEVDAEAGPIACGAPAAYQALSWGYGPGSDEVRCCEDHARAALSDGVEVRGPDGDTYAPNDDDATARIAELEAENARLREDLELARRERGYALAYRNDAREELAKIKHEGGSCHWCSKPAEWVTEVGRWACDGCQRRHGLES